jgi:hypothetical protein
MPFQFPLGGYVTRKPALALRSPLNGSCAAAALDSACFLLLLAERADAGIVELGADLLERAHALEVGVKPLADEPASLPSRRGGGLTRGVSRHFRKDAAEALLAGLLGLHQNVPSGLLWRPVRAAPCRLQRLPPCTLRGDELTNTLSLIGRPQGVLSRFGGTLGPSCRLGDPAKLSHLANRHDARYVECARNGMTVGEFTNTTDASGSPLNRVTQLLDAFASDRKRARVQTCHLSVVAKVQFLVEIVLEVLVPRLLRLESLRKSRVQVLLVNDPLGVVGDALLTHPLSHLAINGRSPLEAEGAELLRV